MWPFLIPHLSKYSLPEWVMKYSNQHSDTHTLILTFFFLFFFAIWWSHAHCIWPQAIIMEQVEVSKHTMFSTLALFLSLWQPVMCILPIHVWCQDSSNQCVGVELRFTPCDISPYPSIFPFIHVTNHVSSYTALWSVLMGITARLKMTLGVQEQPDDTLQNAQLR